MRAGGAGIPGFYTKSGVGTPIAEGKEHHDFDGETYILERGIVADIALVHAYRGDTEGNFNPPAATCGPVTLAEVEELVTDEYLDPNNIVTPGIFVQRIVQARPREKEIEQRTVRSREGAQ